MTEHRRKKPGRPANEIPPQPTASTRPSKELWEALSAYLASLRPPPTVSAILYVALEDFLASKGFWPPSKRKNG